MRCPKCGRLPKSEAPRWALHCQCDANWRIANDEGRLPVAHPCGGCPDTACGSCFDGKHPCGTCPEEKHTDCLFVSGMPKCAALEGWLATVPMDAMVAAIRGDKLVGRGTCSSIDECMDDADLRRELAMDGCPTVEAALKWARKHEGLFLEQGLNQRWGEDNDPQLKAYREFEAADKADPK